MRKLIAIAIAGIACGGAKTSGLDKPKLSLLSTVPNPGGTNDRWADLHFTFSAPVDWTQLVYVDCTSAGCRSPHVPYKFAASGADVVGTPILPPEPGQSYSLFVTPLANDPATASNINFSWTTLPATTSIASDVVTDTTLGPTGSPYFIAPGVLIKAALTIQPGVEVIGDLVAAGAGSVTAIGLPSSHVRISNAVFNAPGRLSYVDAMGTISLAAQDVDHSRIYCGRVQPGTPDVLAVRISSTLTDSRVSGCVVPSMHGTIARNVFVTTMLELGGSAAGPAFGASASFNVGGPPPPTPWDATTSFTNNQVVYNNQALTSQDSYSGIDRSDIWLTHSTGSIRGNTFAGFLARSWNVYPENTTAAAEISGNYWVTTVADPVASYFRAGYVVYKDPAQPGLGPAAPPPAPIVDPMLTAADPTTPAP